MTSDLEVTGYADLAALDRLHVGLGGGHRPAGAARPRHRPRGAREEAAPYAIALGEAFQLTNFLRDVAEDVDRGRVYLPEDLMAAHGVHPRAAGREAARRPVRRR